LLPIIGIAQIFVFVWSLLNIKKNPLHLYLLAWISAYLIFVFYWNNGSNIFWFQTLPAILVLFCLYIENIRGTRALANTKIVPWQAWLLGVTVLLLLVVNTLQTVVPVSLVNMEEKTAELREKLHDGDLLVTAGWDKYKWMGVELNDKKVERLMLMNMAVNSKNHELHVSNLANIVNDHLNNHQRVIVARLYDLDSDANPWAGLKQMGWSRAKLQGLLKAFCNREIGTIDDVVFRELFICPKEKTS